MQSLLGAMASTTSCHNGGRPLAHIHSMRPPEMAAWLTRGAVEGACHLRHGCRPERDGLRARDPPRGSNQTVRRRHIATMLATQTRAPLAALVKVIGEQHGASASRCFRDEAGREVARSACPRAARTARIGGVIALDPETGSCAHGLRTQRHDRASGRMRHEAQVNEARRTA